MVWYPSMAIAARQNFGGIFPLGPPNGKIEGDHLPLIVISHGKARRSPIGTRRRHSPTRASSSPH